MQRLTANLEKWLKHFAEIVRQRDYVAARRLFDNEVVSFGTVCFRADNLDALVTKQWRAAWTITKDFDFDYTSARVLLEGSQAVVVSSWSATGVKRDGGEVKCRGRATIVLHNDVRGWRALHTHYSLWPEGRD